MITMRLWTVEAKRFDLNYEDAAKAQEVWDAITGTGEYPGTGERLVSAYYWGDKRQPGEGPDRQWPVAVGHKDSRWE